MKSIKDEFSELKVSPQRRYQLRHRKHGLCLKCAQKAVTKNYCLRHAVFSREHQRLTKNCKKRLKSRTYRLEKANGVNYIF